MDNITIITDSQGIEQVIIDRGNGEFTSMLKAEYDRLQAEQSTPIDTLPSELVDPAPADKPKK